LFTGGELVGIRTGTLARGAFGKEIIPNKRGWPSSPSKTPMLARVSGSRTAASKHSCPWVDQPTAEILKLVVAATAKDDNFREPWLRVERLAQALVEAFRELDDFGLSSMA
jgi:hypothetical protein